MRNEEYEGYGNHDEMGSCYRTLGWPGQMYRALDQSNLVCTNNRCKFGEEEDEGPRRQQSFFD